MSGIIIQVEKLSKQYRLGEVSTGTLAHDLNRWWHRVRGKEDPYLKVTSKNVREKARGEGGKLKAEAIASPSSAFTFHPSPLSSDYVWALRDVSFEVRRGEVLGIIGRNGAGKSTLLKIMSRITAPTSGEVRLDGRIAALLEVGTGFHPELTGRENIFLNGSVLGMTKAEIRSKLDEIVAFSGCERFIDTPVKRYSSGMVVRLGFAVAAHLEPEILIVDEVLAVGDAEFQRKCLGKMQDVARHGRTVLFVSHNMGAVMSLCPSAMVLAEGSPVFRGPAEEAVHWYTRSCLGARGNDASPGLLYTGPDASAERAHRVASVEALAVDGERAGTLRTWQDVRLRVTFESSVPVDLGGVEVHVESPQGVALVRMATNREGGLRYRIPKGRHAVDLIVRKLPLAAGQYILGCGLTEVNSRWLCFERVMISVEANDVYGTGYFPSQPKHLLVPDVSWRPVEQIGGAD